MVDNNSFSNYLVAYVIVSSKQYILLEKLRFLFVFAIYIYIDKYIDICNYFHYFVFFLHIFQIKLYQTTTEIK